MKSVLQVVQNLLKPYIDTHRQNSESNIAPVETNSTSASRNYSIGEQLILNDVLYDVTASISSGNPLVSGTNISPANPVSVALNELTNKTTKASSDVALTLSDESGIELGTLSKYFTIGNICHVALNVKLTSASTDGNTISGKINLPNGILGAGISMAYAGNAIFALNLAYNGSFYARHVGGNVASGTGLNFIILLPIQP